MVIRANVASFIQFVSDHKYFQLGTKRKECQVSLVGHFCFVEIKTEVKEKLSSGIADEK